jgi:hypothetical protein
LSSPPSSFICASAIGIYGQRSGSAETPVTEADVPYPAPTAPTDAQGEPTHVAVTVAAILAYAVLYILQ